MNGNRSLLRGRAQWVKIQWAEQENEQPAAIEIALKAGRWLGTRDLPALRSRPRREQKALQKVELAPRQRQLTPA